MQKRGLLLVTRSAFIVDGPLALRSQRLAAAREAAIGRDILTFPLLAARLAGGFLRPIDVEALREAAVMRALLPLESSRERGGQDRLPELWK